MEAIEIYQCNECHSMNTENEPGGHVAAGHCANCGSSDIQWFVGTKCSSMNEIDNAKNALAFGCIRTNAETLELYERADQGIMATGRSTAVCEAFEWLTDKSASEPDLDDQPV